MSGKPIWAMLIMVLAGCSSQQAAPGSDMENQRNAYQSSELKKGQKFKFRITLGQMGQSVYQATALPTRSLLAHTLKLTVGDTNANGSYGIAVDILAVRSVQEDQRGRSEWDSEHAQAGDAALRELYGFWVGKRLSFVLDKNGLVDTVLGTNELLQGLYAKLQVPAGKAADAFRLNMIRQFGPQAWKQILQSCFLPMPPQAFDTPELTWKAPRLLPGEFPMPATVQYRVDSVGAQTVALSLESLYSFDSTQVIELGGMRIRPNMRGVLQGTAQADKAKKHIISSEYTNRLIGTLAVEGAAGVPSELTIIQTVELLP